MLILSKYKYKFFFFHFIVFLRNTIQSVLEQI